MRKASLLAALTLVMQAVAAASQHGSDMTSGDLWLLAFTLVVLGGLALYIYLRVQEAGILTFIPQTAIEEE